MNFRVDPAVMQDQLPSPLRPKIYNGAAIAGICLIRLEEIRPSFVPALLGLSSENAAHRVAVVWDDERGIPREGVYIRRRDSDSMANQVLGGRVFPGYLHAANFTVIDAGGEIDLSMKSTDGEVAIHVRARTADGLPRGSIFRSLSESSRFFEQGSLGYSATNDPHRLDGMSLHTDDWLVQPLAVDEVHTSYFEDASRFPAGSAQFDHALIMRDIEHEWHAAPSLGIELAV